MKGRRMRVSRVLLLVVVASAVAGAVATSAGALAFTDTPCPPDGALKICSNGIVGDPYAVQLTGRAGTGCWPYDTFSLTGDGDLPPGLSLSMSGLITGTPTKTGTWLFYVAMSDYIGPDDPWCTTIKSTQRQFSITILPAAEIGRQFMLPLTAADRTSGYAWALTAGSSLPAGLTLDSEAGLISGRPTASGVFATKLQAPDALGRTKTLDLTITVAPPLTIRRRTLPAAKTHHAYHARLTTSGGVTPIRWTIARGSLPAGLHLNPQTGELAGKPSHSGTSHPTIQVKDRLGAVSKTTFTLKVVA
jgi:hypothetical protein